MNELSGQSIARVEKGATANNLPRGNFCVWMAGIGGRGRPSIPIGRNCRYVGSTLRTLS